MLAENLLRTTWDSRFETGIGAGSIAWAEGSAAMSGESWSRWPDGWADRHAVCNTQPPPRDPTACFGVR